MESPVGVGCNDRNAVTLSNHCRPAIIRQIQHTLFFEVTDLTHSLFPLSFVFVNILPDKNDRVHDWNLRHCFIGDCCICAIFAANLQCFFVLFGWSVILSVINAGVGEAVLLLYFRSYILYATTFVFVLVFP